MACQCGTTCRPDTIGHKAPNTNMLCYWPLALILGCFDFLLPIKSQRVRQPLSNLSNRSTTIADRFLFSSVLANGLDAPQMSGLFALYGDMLGFANLAGQLSSDVARLFSDNSVPAPALWSWPCAPLAKAIVSMGGGEVLGLAVSLLRSGVRTLIAAPLEGNSTEIVLFSCEPDNM